MKSKSWKTIGLGIFATLLVVALMIVSFQIDITPKNSQSKVCITIGNRSVVEASGLTAPDYYTTGVNDNVPFQQALNALPAVGGELMVLSGTYNFAATVTRAIANVTITGTGRGTYFTYDGVTPIFTAGGNNWKFENLRTDAGSLTMGATTGWIWENVTINATYYTYRTDSTGNITTGALTDSGLTAGRVPFAGAGGLLSDEAAFAYNSGTNTLSTDNLDAPTGRTASRTVAFSNSDDVNKKNADYVFQATSATDAANITIDTAALNALTALLTQGGKVFFYAGDGWTNSVVSYYDGTTFEGENWNSTKLMLANNANCNMFQRIGAGAGTNYFTCFKNMYIGGNKDNNTSGTGIYSADITNDYIIQDCFIENFDTNNVYIKGGWNISIKGCIFEHSSGAAVYVDGGQDVRIIDNKFLYNYRGIYAYMEDGKISQNFFYHLPTESRSRDVYGVMAKNNIIMGNTFIGDNSVTALACISFSDVGGGNVITGNTFNGKSITSYAVYDASVNSPSSSPNIISNNKYLNFLTDNVFQPNNKNLIFGSLGKIQPGEPRYYSGALTAGTVGNAVMAFQNPNTQALMATGTTRITAGSTAAATADWGLANTVQVVENGEDVWASGTHGASATNAGYDERGTYCNAITIASGITNNDIVGYEDFGAMDVSTATHLLFKFRSTVALNASDVAILLDETSACVSPSFTLNLPSIVENATALICLPINAGAASGASCDAVISVGLQVLVNTRAVAGTVLYIDDIRAVTVGTGLVNDANLQTLGNAVYGTTTPVQLDAKNDDDADSHDTLVMVSAANDTTGIVGSWYVTGQGE